MKRGASASYKGAEQRIVCLAPDMVEVVYALGLGRSIVGWSAYTDYPPEVERRDGWKPYGFYYSLEPSDFDAAEELSHEVSTVSKYYGCNFDIIDGLRPTVIFGSGQAQQPMTDELKARGYNACCFTSATLDEVYAMIVEVGRRLGAEDRARKLVSGYYAEIEKIRAVTSKLTPVPVYFEIAHRTGTHGPYTTARGTPFEEMLEIAGGRNVFGDLDGSYVEVGFEEIVKRDPAVIMSPCWPGAMDEEITTLYEIMTRKGFDRTGAVRNGRVLYYDSGLMKRFGPRSVTAIKKLAYLLHPYSFKDPGNSVSPWELGRIDVFEKPERPLR